MTADGQHFAVRSRRSPAPDVSTLPKILFADHLRGVAALLVVVSHLVVFYWVAPEGVAAYTYSPQSVTPQSVIRQLAGFDLGSFGVGLFFLISGFVIPMSLERLTTPAFLVARLLRIWPTYLAALGLDLAVQYASASFWHIGFRLDCEAILANVFMLQGTADWPSLDLVNWTLAIEVQFYLLLAVIYPMILVLRERAVFYAACVLPVMLALQMLVPSMHFGLAPTRSVACLAYMLVGTLVWLHLQGRITRRTMLVTGGAAVTAITLSLSKCIGPMVPTGFAEAFTVFITLFMLRDRIGPNRVLSALSAISYPLYLVHSVLGFAILQAMRLRLGVRYPEALSVSLAAVVGTAILLHVLLERPSMLLGKRLSARVMQGGRLHRRAAIQPEASA